jgi:hypothetical protein
VEPKPASKAVEPKPASKAVEPKPASKAVESTPPASDLASKDAIISAIKNNQRISVGQDLVFRLNGDLHIAKFTEKLLKYRLIGKSGKGYLVGRDSIIGAVQ